MHLDRIELPSGHLDQLADFYGSVFGLPVARDGAAVTATVGASALRFVPAAAPTSPFHFAFNVPSAQFADARAWLEARVPLLAGESGETVFHSGRWNADMVYYRDPAGHIGELIARREPPHSASGPFGPQSLLCVSEIGLAVADVIGAAERLAALDIPPYHADPDPGFMSLGDANGLLIVVRAGRMWYPDRITPAPAQPIRVELRQGERRLTLTADADGEFSLA